MTPIHECIVIGAGAAGLSAAVTLNDAGRDLILLEARDRLGGRAHSVPLSDGTLAELGAQQVNGPTIATWDYIARFGLDTHRLEQSSMLRPWGKDVPLWRRGEWVLDGDIITQEAFDRLDEVRSVPNRDDISLRDALLAAGLSGARLEVAESMFTYLMPAEEVSARAVSEVWHIWDSVADPVSGVTRPGNPNFALVDGYSRLWEELSCPIIDVIHLNTPVTAIEWSEEGVIARNSNQEVRGRSAIVTIPVGVLKSGTVRFSPALPQRKQAALDKLGRGQTTSVLAEFRRPWWEDWIGPAHSFRRGESSPFRTFGSLFWDRPGPPALRSGVSWPYAMELTSHPDRIRSLFLETLTEMFEGVDIEAELVSIEVTDWTSDPWTMGGPGAIVPVGSYQLRADLATPTPPLFWAGEATHTRGHADTVHGALEMGRRAALEVLHTLRPLYVTDPEARLNWWEYSPWRTDT